MAFYRLVIRQKSETELLTRGLLDQWIARSGQEAIRLCGLICLLRDILRRVELCLLSCVW